MSRQTTSGFKVVLTADGTLMADYRALLDGMVAAAQTTMVPGVVMKRLLAPPLRGSDVAPLGLRRVEAALLTGGFAREEVAIVPPTGLKGAVGSETRIVGISSGDPLGLGMNSTTMAGLSGGRPYTEYWFERLAGRVRALVAPGSKLKVVMGGPGAWQLANDEAARKRLGIDHVVAGYCEEEIGDIFGRICRGEESREVIECTRQVTAPPTIRGASCMGVVEVSRGCGLGCGFCTMGRAPMAHFPVASVLEDARVNVRSGLRELSLISEDVFRYGARSPREADAEALKELLGRLREIPGLGRMHVDHANISSVAQMSDVDLAAIRKGLTGDDDTRYLWVNLGVESASPRLLAANCGGKLRPYTAEEWPEACYEQVRRLASAGFVPMVSLLMGMPGETEEDVAETVRWVGRLREERVTAFPMFVAATEAGTRSFTAGDMTKTHWRLVRECYRLNFKWFPRLVWDNQRGTGVALWRRLALQGAGRAVIPGVKTMLALKCGGRG